MNFICEENGAEKIYYIEELNVDRDATWLYDEMEDTWTPIFGGGCYAEFAGINVKSIRFTVEVPEGQEKAAVSEIALVGAFGSEA